MPIPVFVSWLLLLWLLAPIAFPFSARLWMARSADSTLGTLPDGGWMCGRVLLLTLWTLGAFWAGNAGLPVRLAPIILIFLAALSLWRWKCEKNELLAQLRRHLRAIVAIDVTFLLIFAIFFALRCLWPDFDNGEKPMDIALIGACARADHLPPPNPYLAGARLGGYYYLGHLQTALLSDAISAPIRWTYNLMAATLPALCFTLLMSLAGAITGRLRRGAVAAFLVLILGTLEPLRQWIETDVNGLRHWPFGELPLDYFSTSRVIPNPISDSSGINYTINEFPFFTFTYADLHAHYFAVPVCLLILSLGWALFAQMQPRTISLEEVPKSEKSTRQRLALRLARALSWRVWLAGVVMAALVITNTWDVPAYWLFLSLCLWPSRHNALQVLAGEEAPTLSKTARKKAEKADKKAGRIVQQTPEVIELDRRSFAVTWPLLTVSMLLFSVLYLLRLHTNAHSPSPLSLPATPLLAWLLMWGVIVSAWSLALWDDARQSGRDWRSWRWLLLPLLVWGILKFGPQWSWRWTWPRALPSDLPVVYQNGDYSVPILVATLGIASLRAVFTTSRPHFSLLCRMATCGFVALMWSELTWAGFLVPAPSGPTYHRQDTVFKFGLQGWYLIGIAAACAALLAASTCQRENAENEPASTCDGLDKPLWRRWWFPVQLSYALAFCVMALASWSCLQGRTRNFNEELRAAGQSIWKTPDAWAHLAAPEQEAAQWLQERAHDGDTLLEAEQQAGGDYSNFARYAHATGIPTIIGPSAHTFQWGHDKQDNDQMWVEVARRKADARRFYTTPSQNERDMISKAYDIDYVVVGELERQEYGVDVERLAAIYPQSRVFGDASDPHHVLIINLNPNARSQS